MGMMDAVQLSLQLEALDTENRRRNLGDSRRDLIVRTQTLEAWARQLRIPDLIAMALIRRGEIQLKQGEGAGAVESLTQARQDLRGLRESDLLVRVLVLLADAYHTLGDWAKVAEMCKEGVDLVETYRDKVSAPYLQSAYLRSRIRLYSLGAQAAYILGDFAAALTIADLSKSRGVLQRAGAAEGKPGEQSRYQREFARLCAQIDDARERGSVPAKLLAKRRVLWELLSIARAKAGREALETTVSVTAIQRQLAGDEAILYYYWLAPGALLIFSMNCDALVAELKAIPLERYEAMHRFAHNVLALGRQGNVNVGHLDQVQRFADTLLPKEGVRLFEGRARLQICAHRLLHALPFHALRWQGDYLIRRMAISYIPNLASRILHRQSNAGGATLALGVEAYAVPETPLPNLPKAKQEMRDLSAVYDDAGQPLVTLVNHQATESQLKALQQSGRLAQFNCLHIACHGVNVDSDSPAESYLYLYDSRLEGVEIANLSLNADLVVLSACCSGQRPISGRGMAELPGDDMFGLQDAFITAGARQVVGTLWPVDSEAAAAITTALHRYRLAGEPADLALQHAVCDYLRQAGVLKRNVYYWAPFFLTVVGRN